MKFQNQIGLDIGGSTLKLAQLVANKEKFVLSSIGIVESPWVSGDASKDLMVAEAIKKLLKETVASGKRVVIGLPESEVYTRVIDMPYLEEPELSSAIKWQAEQYIPVSLSDVVMKHQVLSLPQTGVPGAKMRVLLVAAPNTLVNRFLTITGRVGLEVIAVETEIFAVARAIIASDKFSPTTLLVNFGLNTTTLAILQRGDMFLTQSVGVGGMALSRILSTELGLEISQAEEYKRSYGFDGSKLEGKVMAKIKPIIDIVLTEMKKVVAYYETRPQSQPIKRIVLCGGTALMPGLVSYFTENFGVEVQLGNPFTNLILSDKQKQVVYDLGPLFTSAVGLAMKSV